MQPEMHRCFFYLQSSVYKARMTASYHWGVNMIPKETIAENIRSHGVKPTTQRLEIAMLLLSAPRHMSADQILADLRIAGSHISKATVYNTLNLFTRHSLLREVSADSNRQFYDSTITPHHHFYNIDTGELTDIKQGDLAFSSLPELPAGTEAQDVEVIVRVRNAADARNAA